MPPYAYLPSTFNGTSIQTAQYKSYFLVANSPVQTGPASPIEAVIAGLGTRYVRRQPGPATWRLVVNLSSINETDLTAFYRLFSKELGLATLVATDGAGASWYVQVEILAHELQSPMQFHVVLRVPDPRWRENTATTNTHAGMSGDTHAIPITNNGTLDALPQITITPKAVKGAKGILESYKYNCRGFWTNRSRNAWNGLPVLLSDIDGADAGGFDHLAKIIQAGVSNLINKVGGVTAGDTVIPVDTDTGGGLPAAGLAYCDFEQFSYTEKYSLGAGAYELRGCVRGLGGTTAATHADNTPVYLSEGLINGDDVRVYWAGAEIPCWLSGSGTANLRVWACPSAPARLELTIVKAMTASVPGITESLRFNERVDELPPAGWIAIGSELVYYVSRAGYEIEIGLRGGWGTTAASHSTGARAYRVDGRYYITLGRANAGPAPRPPALRPAIDLVQSRNNKWAWGDEGSDASTVIYDPAAPNRPAMWATGFDSDGNAVSPLMQLSASKTSLQFKDDRPSEGKPPFNYAEVFLPQGVKANAVGDITIDWTPAAEILNLELWGKDSTGYARLLDQLQQSAAAAGRVLPAALAVPMYTIKLKGRYNIHTGFRGDDSDAEACDNSVDPGGQGGNGNASTAGLVRCSFTIAKDGPIPTIVIRYRLSTASVTQQCGITLWTESGTMIDVSNAMIRTLPSGDGTTWQWMKIDLVPGQLYKAGSYTVNLRRVAPFNSVIAISRVAKGRQVGVIERHDGSAWRGRGDQSGYFYVLAGYAPDNTAYISSEQPVLVPSTGARTGTTASFDKIILTLNDATADPQTPYVHCLDQAAGKPAWASTYYHVCGKLTHGGTTDFVVFDAFTTPSGATGSIVADFETRQVYLTEAGYYEPAAGGFEASNPGQPLRLLPGSNNLTWDEMGMANTDFVSVHRGVKE